LLISSLRALLLSCTPSLFGVIVFVDGASVPVSCLFSITASLKHGARHDKLLQHCEAIGGAGPVYLVFVMPRHIESSRARLARNRT
jgi:hypothetical protein